MNLVNVHLFHDASNLTALISSPSIYSENRKKALLYTLECIKKNQSNQEPEQNFAIFGDFNFRLDLSALVDVRFFICKIILEIIYFYYLFFRTTHLNQKLLNLKMKTINYLKLSAMTFRIK